MTKTCTHFKTNGRQCGAAAVRDLRYCYFHARFHDLNDTPGNPDYEVPDFDDQTSIQLFLAQITRAVISGEVSSTQANFMLNAARLALANMKFAAKQSSPPDRRPAPAEPAAEAATAISDKA